MEELFAHQDVLDQLPGQHLNRSWNKISHLAAENSLYASINSAEPNWVNVVKAKVEEHRLLAVRTLVDKNITKIGFNASTANEKFPTHATLAHAILLGHYLKIVYNILYNGKCHA